MRVDGGAGAGAGGWGRAVALLEGDLLVWMVAWGRKGGYGTYVGEGTAAAGGAECEVGVLAKVGMRVVAAHVELGALCSVFGCGLCC